MPYTDTFSVLINEEEQYCQWGEGAKVPLGWKVVGRRMGKEESLARIEELWTDMRPKKVREAMKGWDAYTTRVMAAGTAEVEADSVGEEARKAVGSRVMEKAPRSPWLLTFGDRPKAVLRVFCFPYLGGSADFVKDFQPLMPPQIEIIAVQYPGHGRRMGQSPINDLSTFLLEASAALLPAIRGAPEYAFFGYSMGCFLSHELACYLKTHHNTWPDKMVMCCQNPKFVPCSDPILDRLTDQGIIDQLKSVGGLPDALLQSEELMMMMIPLYRADSRLSEQDEDDARKWLSVLNDGKQVLLDAVFYGYAGQGEKEITRTSLTNWGKLSSTHKRPGHTRIFEGGHFMIEKSHDLLCQMLAKDLLAEDRSN